MEHRTRKSGSPEVQVSDVQLWLPSAIAGQTFCDRHLQKVEWKLREAQANDALDTVRQHLRLDSYLTKKKKDWSHGVKANTRSQMTIEQNRLKMRIAVEKYRAAYKVMEALGALIQKPDAWKKTLKALNDEDIRGLPVDTLQVGEGHLKLPWIWMAPGVLDGAENPEKDPRMHDGEPNQIVFAGNTYIITQRFEFSGVAHGPKR
jgi:hypothetical protein